MSELLTVSDLAKELKVSPRSVYEMLSVRGRRGALKTHPLPCVRINRRTIRFRMEDVNRWLADLAKDEQR